jgi:hypothetical protein
MYTFTSLLSYIPDKLLYRERGDSTLNSLSESCLSIGSLAEAKKSALRRCVWFRSLNRLERGIIDLTVRYVDNIKSIKLAKIVTAIIGKLQHAMESSLDRLVRTIGLPLAQKISNIAVSWGNHLASLWAEDRAFARFLIINFAKSRFGLET